MKNFFVNYGFYIYLALTVLNYVFIYFRTGKGNGKNELFSSIAQLLSIYVADKNKDKDKNKNDGSVEKLSSVALDLDSLVDSQSIEKKIELVNRLCSEIVGKEGNVGGVFNG